MREHIHNSGADTCFVYDPQQTAGGGSGSYSLALFGKKHALL